MWQFFFSESGFKPIVEGQGGSIPTLAFSVNDGAERPPVTADLYHQDFLQRRQDLLDDFVVNQLAQVDIINSNVINSSTERGSSEISKNGEGNSL